MHTIILRTYARRCVPRDMLLPGGGINPAPNYQKLRRVFDKVWMDGANIGSTVVREVTIDGDKFQEATPVIVDGDDTYRLVGIAIQNGDVVSRYERQ